MDKFLNVAVLDDEKAALDIVSASVKKMFSSEGVITEPDSFTNARDLWKALNAKNYDLLFLDIKMPGIDGIEFAKKIVGHSPAPDIIFCSSNSDKVFDSFAVPLFGFVRKSNFVKDLTGVISRYVKYKFSKDETILRFEIKNKSGYLSIDLKKLKYVECVRNKQILYLDGQEAKETYSTMTQFEEVLLTNGFIRIHKGYLVNCRYIRRFDTNTVTLLTGEELPVGRSKHDEALNAYLSFIHKNGVSVIG